MPFWSRGMGNWPAGRKGRGGFAEVPEIAEEIETILTPKDLRGEQILVTAGPTQEPFDPVRYITNYSSGKMGYALAVMARRRGAAVTLVSGPTALPAPQGVVFVPVKTALEMRDAVMARLEEATVVIKAAAVADYRPAACAEDEDQEKGWRPDRLSGEESGHHLRGRQAGRETASWSVSPWNRTISSKTPGPS